MLGWLKSLRLCCAVAGAAEENAAACGLPPDQRGFSDFESALGAAEGLLFVAESSGNTDCGRSALIDAEEVLRAVLESVPQSDSAAGIRALRGRVRAFDISSRVVCDAESLTLLQDAASSINLARRRALSSGEPFPIDTIEVRAGQALLGCGQFDRSVRVLRAAATASDAAPYDVELGADESAARYAVQLALGKALLASSSSAAAVQKPARVAEVLERAAAAFRAALAIVPTSHDALVDGGLVQARQGQYAAAAAMYRRAIDVSPASLAARSNLAVAAVQLGLHDEAETQLRLAIDLAPDNAALWNNLGSILPSERIDEKLEAFERAVALQPDMAPALASLADSANAEGDTPRAEELLLRAITAVQAKQGAHSTVTAMRVKRATLVPRLFRDVAHGVATRRRFIANVRALTLEAEAEHASGGAVTLALVDTAALRASATCLGYYLVYTGLEQREMKEGLAKMYCTLAAPTLAQISPHIAALGRNAAAPLLAGVELRRRAALVAAGGTEASLPALPPLQRLRVGFLSSFWREHSVSKLLRVVASSLPRDSFHAFALIAGSPADAVGHPATYSSEEDPVRRYVLEHIESAVDVPVEPLLAAQRAIAKLELDVLVFCDVGMAHSTYWLTFSRLAPRQLAFWGHPVTTGVPTVDYFVSPRFFERDGTAAAQHKFSETLVPFEKSLSTAFMRPLANLDLIPSGFSRRWASPLLGDDETPLYMAPYQLSKFHPAMDSALLWLLRRVPSARLAIFSSGSRSSVATRSALAARFEAAAKAMYGAEIGAETCSRIVWLGAQPLPRFLATIALADAVLETFPFGGGVTTLELLSLPAPLGPVPIVAFPAALPCGQSAPGDGVAEEETKTALHGACTIQITEGIYRQMNISKALGRELALVAESTAEWVDHAVRLGTDRAFRLRVQAILRQRIASADLYGDRKSEGKSLYAAAQAEWAEKLIEIAADPLPHGGERLVPCTFAR